MPLLQQRNPIETAFFQTVIQTLNANQISYLVGGAHALEFYTGAVRDTKDFDIFVRRRDCERILDLFAGRGFATGMTHPHWLGKILFEGYVVDVIFCSGNGLAVVDDDWFRYAVEGQVYGNPVKFAPAEEIIYSKLYIMERERFDGADVAHLVLVLGDRLDWLRLLRLMGMHWRVLLAHLILFEFCYPSARDKIPSWLTAELYHRLNTEMAGKESKTPICFGTFVSREQYLIDIEKWGYIDARTSSPQSMTDEDIRRWTKAIRENR